MENKFDVILLKDHLTKKLIAFENMLNDLEDDSDAYSLCIGRISFIEDLLADIELGRFNHPEE